jgi:two-component system KDP operon response regulator KdpE
MIHKPRIVVIEDEPEIRRFLATSLEGQGYLVTVAPNAKAGLKIVSTHPPDLVILDLGLPDMDGKDVIQSIREWSQVPIIVLSARDHEPEKVAALEMGADDYLTKPFSTPELAARIKVALRRRSRKEHVEEQTYTFKSLTIDLLKREITLKSKILSLTPTEYDLLAALTRKAGQVVTQSELLRTVWGKNADENDHYIRIYVQKLRQKIGDDPLNPQYIFTEPGVGYRLVEE